MSAKTLYLWRASTVNQDDEIETLAKTSIDADEVFSVTANIKQRAVVQAKASQTYNLLFTN